MKIGYDYDIACNFGDLKSPELIGERPKNLTVEQFCLLANNMLLNLLIKILKKYFQFAIQFKGTPFHNKIGNFAQR